MEAAKTTFALYFGNRGMFPGSLMASARQEMVAILKGMGHDVLLMDESATRFGAVETPEEGRIYAKFLEENKGKFGGVILTLPNFGDENGAMAALKNAGVPIFIHAYPDDLDKMAPELRRDAFCGKFSIMDVFWQAGIKYTIAKPHTVSPHSERFADNIDFFDRVCRVYNGMKDMVLGALGARTTAFKTVRFDEVTLQRHGITVEAFDLSDVFKRMDDIASGTPKLNDKIARLRSYTCWEGVPEDRLEQISRLGVVIDDMVDEYRLDCIALRCWVELQAQLGISPCVLLSEMNDRGIAASCEVDVGNAVAMHALKLATGQPATCLDWNNNFADEDDKCILFHCGPVPQSLMAGPGRITDHAILRNVVGEGCAFGCNVGRIAPMDFTYASSLTAEGRVKFYVGEGKFTEDPIAEDFFGCAGVAQIKNLQDVLYFVGKNGYRHHVSCAPGNVKAAMVEAFTNYLGYDVAVL